MISFSHLLASVAKIGKSRLLNIIVWALALTFLGITIYRGWFMKTNVSHQTVVVQEGGTNIGQQNLEPKKRFEPFFEFGPEINTKGEFRGYLRCGLRF